MGVRLTNEVPPPRTFTQGSGGPITKEEQERGAAVLLDLRPHVHQPTYINEEAIRRESAQYRTPDADPEVPTVASAEGEVGGDQDGDREVSSERGMGAGDSSEEVSNQEGNLAAGRKAPLKRKSRRYSDWMNPAVQDDRRVDPVAVRNMISGLDTRTKLYTLREAAVVLRHSPAWMREQIKKGRIKARKMGGKFFISGYELSRQIGEVGHGKRKMTR